jgi:hypothetical protein
MLDQSETIGTPANGIPALSQKIKDRANGNAVAEVLNVDEDRQFHRHRMLLAAVFSLDLLFIETQCKKPLKQSEEGEMR